MHGDIFNTNSTLINCTCNHILGKNDECNSYKIAQTNNTKLKQVLVWLKNCTQTLRITKTNGV